MEDGSEAFIHLPMTIPLAKTHLHVIRAYVCVCGYTCGHTHVDAGEQTSLSFSGTPSIFLETGSLIGLEHTW